MSYKITCYCNDETIKKTSVYISSIGNTYSGTYGSSSLGDYEEFTVSGLTESWSAKFTVTPASGCSFYRWVYRVGSSSAAVQYNYNSTFTYTGGQDIYIRAEGTQDVETWDLSTGAFGAISSSVSDSFYLGEMQMYRYSVTFNYSGTATIYTEGSVDTYGYFGTSSSFDDYDGVPNSYYESDDDSNGSGNFLITYNVTAGTTYYVWIRSYSGDDTGYVDLYIDPPARTWTLSGTSLGTISANKTVSLSISSYTLYRRTVTFSKSGTAKFYTTGTSTDTYGYLSTSSSWDNTTGRPTDYLKSDDDSNGAPNFLISYEVTAGTTYYVWVRGYSATTTGSTTLNIEPPADSWTLVTGAFGTISSEASASFTLGTNQMRRYSVSFENSGSANFFAMGSEDTWGYLSTTTGFDSTNGMPTSYLAEDGTSGPGDNFAITYNVTAGTTYYVWVCESYGESTGTIELYVQPPEKTISITKWSWTASNGNASASQTQAAYSAVVNKTAVTNFSYLVWNDLCDKVKEILDATGGSWDSTYATYANTKMTSSNKTLTATKFNSLRYNIGSHYSTGIADVASNDDVLGSYFTKLASCINGWIDTL